MTQINSKIFLFFTPKSLGEKTRFYLSQDVSKLDYISLVKLNFKQGDRIRKKASSVLKPYHQTHTQDKAVRIIKKNTLGRNKSTRHRFLKL